jgi:hypothetical protein
MGVFRKREPSHLIPVSPDNAASKDWVILLEAGLTFLTIPQVAIIASTVEGAIRLEIDPHDRKSH